MRRAVLGIFGGVLLSLLVPFPAMAFDCAKAASRVEKLICAKPALKALDSAMAKAYGELKSSLPAAQQAWLGRSQVAWIQRRSGNCSLDDDAKPMADEASVVCLERLTEERRAMLSGARDDAPATAPRLIPVFFHQAGGKRRYEIDLSYPQAASPGSGSLNALLRQAAEGDRPWQERIDPDDAGASFAFYAEYRIALQTDGFLSVVFNRMTSTTSPYPRNEQKTVNFDLKTGQAATLATLLRPGAQAEAGKACLAQLRKYYGPDPEPTITPKAVNAVVGDITNWVFEPNRIVVEFAYESIGPHAMGEYACTFDGATAATMLRPGGAVGVAAH